MNLIRLERDPDNPHRERLVGIDPGETVILPDIATSVANCKRLCKYVVALIAANRARHLDPNFRYNPDEPAPEPMLTIMGEVRLELLGPQQAQPTEMAGK